MTEAKIAWSGEVVRTWLQSRFEAARSEQDRVINRRDREDDHDVAAAEEYVLQIAKSNVATDSQDRFIAFPKDLLDKDDYRSVGAYDERRFDRAVRTYLRKLIKMAKANAGFDNLSRFQ